MAHPPELQQKLGVLPCMMCHATTDLASIHILDCQLKGWHCTEGAEELQPYVAFHAALLASYQRFVSELATKVHLVNALFAVLSLCSVIQPSITLRHAIHTAPEPFVLTLLAPPQTK